MNRSPTNCVINKTPAELRSGYKPDVGKKRVFGCQAFVLNPKEKRSKFHLKSKEVIMIGYGVNGYRLLDPVSGTVVIARNVRFNERKFPFNQPATNESEERIELPIKRNSEYSSDAEGKREQVSWLKKFKRMSHFLQKKNSKVLSKQKVIFPYTLNQLANITNPWKTKGEVIENAEFLGSLSE